MEAQREATPARKLCWGSLGVGAALAVIGVSAMTIDFRNNHAFGAKISPEMGAVMALAALALTALPAAAALLGRWDWRLTAGTAFATVLTIVAAISAYSDRQGAEILARQGAGDAYEQAVADAKAARKDIDAAKAEAAAIAETATVEDLLAMVARERELAQIEAKDRGGRGAKAKAHEDAEKAAMDRVPAARAKAAAAARVAAAQARLDKAQDATKAGPVEVSMLASILGAKLGRAPAEVAKAIALITTVISIGVTLVLALLSEQATSLVMKGLGLQGVATEHMPRPAPHPVAKPSPKGKAKVPASDAELIALFIGQLRPGGQVTRYDDLYGGLLVFWATHAPGRPIPQKRTLSNALLKARIERRKIGGQIHYHAAMH